MPEVNYLAVLLAALSAFCSAGSGTRRLCSRRNGWPLTGNECAEGEKPKGNMAMIFGGAFLLNPDRGLCLAMFIGDIGRKYGAAPGLAGRPLLGRDQLRRQLSVRAAPVGPVADQRRLFYAAVHALRADPGGDGTGRGLGGGAVERSYGSRCRVPFARHGHLLQIVVVLKKGEEEPLETCRNSAPGAEIRCRHRSASVLGPAQPFELAHVECRHPWRPPRRKSPTRSGTPRANLAGMDVVQPVLIRDDSPRSGHPPHLPRPSGSRYATGR